MILDLDQFIARERPYWDELEQVLDHQASGGGGLGGLGGARRFQYLYQRVSADLSKIQTFSGERETTRYLEQLVARAYVELHGDRDRSVRFSFVHWFMRTWPETFRRHVAAFWFAFGVTFLGGVFGAYVLDRDPENMFAVLPAQFAHLLEDPSERVKEEEERWASGNDFLEGSKSVFAGQLMLNNIKVAIMAMAFGVLFGVLTIVMLFYNGIILGAVVHDYVRAGETEFLLGWLLPHGVPELTAIFMGGQAGFVLARAVLGWGSELGLRARLRSVRGDLATIVGGFALMLVWAGVVEAFFSQYHYPVVSYSTKILFGAAELLLLIAFFGWVGRRPKEKGTGDEAAGGGAPGPVLRSSGPAA